MLDVGDLHGEDQENYQPKVKSRHGQTLCGCHLEVALLCIGALAKHGETSGQGKNKNQQKQKTEMLIEHIVADHEHPNDYDPHHPQPRRECRGHAATVQKTDWREVEKV